MLVPLALAATRTCAFVASDVMPWLAKFATRAMARRLDVPEIVVHAICLYVAAYVSEVERNASPVCPLRVLRKLRRQRRVHARQSSRAPV